MDGVKPVGREYKGHSGIARDSMWLTNEDLKVAGVTEVTVTIEKVLIFDEVEFEAGRSKENFLGLQFVGKKRLLGLNATNRKTLNELHGETVAGWYGKQITLFITQARKGRQMVDCLRIRAAAGTPKRKNNAAEFLKPEQPKLDPAGDAETVSPPAEPRDPVALNPAQALVDQACAMLGVTDLEKAALIEQYGGDLAAVNEALNRRADERGAA